MKRTSILKLAVAATLFAVGGPLAAAPVDDAFVAALAGGWAGGENQTPIGRMPFGLVFAWQDDGSLLARSSYNRETFVELRLAKDAAGRWMLHERAAMEGLGEQGYTLEPLDGPGALRLWAYAVDPSFLRVEAGITGDRLYMKVMLRGEEHAVFDLTRLDAAGTVALAARLREAADRDPATAPIGDAAGGQEVPPAIRAGRAAVAERPGDAGARLQLARALLAAIQADPMAAGPRFAAEMLSALYAALDLDPSRAETYRMLVGYHLHAPPIAGGSIEKAEALAGRLAAVDAEAGAAALAEVAAAKAR